MSTGPFKSERAGSPRGCPGPASRRAGEREPSLRMLLDVLLAADVELGAYDRRIVEWLARWEPATCAVIAGLVSRAGKGGER
jgi:hypothetical protein